MRSPRSSASPKAPPGPGSTGPARSSVPPSATAKGRQSMDEMTLLAEMREDVRSHASYPAALRALMAEIAGEPPAPARRFSRRPVLISAMLAGAVAAGTVAVAVTSGDEPHAPPTTVQVTSPPSLTRVTSPMTLAANATVLARQAPVPGPTAWIYEKKETTSDVTPSHRITEAWTRV